MARLTPTQKLAAISLGAVVVVFWLADFGLCFLDRRDRLIYAGWFVQLIALWLIFRSISNRERSVSGENALGRLWTALTRWYPRKRRDTVAKTTGAAAMALASMNAIAEAWKSPPEGATHSERIDALEHNVAMMRASTSARLEGLEQVNRQLSLQLSQALAKETTERVADVQKLRADSKAVAREEIRVGYWNVLLLFIGITVATVPDGVLYVFAWVYRSAPVLSCWRG